MAQDAPERAAKRRGRPRLTEGEARTRTVAFRLTPEEAAKFERLGGRDWIVAVLQGVSL